MKKMPIPKFRTEEEEIQFWSKHDSTQHVDWSRATKVTLSNLNPSTRNISLRLPESLLDELKLIAHKRDIPYQSLMKIFLAERIKKELAA